VKQDKTQRKEELIAARKSCNLLQEQVAKAVGISYRHYQNIEGGECRPNVETAISIARLLNRENDIPALFASHTANSSTN
jgi:DNA-binding XRE family transcriptional regulator